MGFFDYFDKKAKVPLPVEVVEALKPAFTFARQWVCACGATLRVRSREDRGEGPSNYTAGKRPLDAGDLNWEGLAVERGWSLNPTTCPACREGLTVAEFKRKKARS